jgi:yecA family protein
MDGFFCALIAGPDTVMPSEYLPILWGGELTDENVFASLEDANATLQLVIRHWNSIISEPETDGGYGAEIDDPEERTAEVQFDRDIHRRQRRTAALDSARCRRGRRPMAGRAALR